MSFLSFLLTAPFLLLGSALPVDHQSLLGATAASSAQFQYLDFKNSGTETLQGVFVGDVSDYNIIESDGTINASLSNTSGITYKYSNWTDQNGGNGKQQDVYAPDGMHVGTNYIDSQGKIHPNTPNAPAAVPIPDTPIQTSTQSGDAFGSAQSSGSTGSQQGNGIVPCGNSSAPNVYGSLSCDLCSFGQLVQNIINFLVGITIPIAVFLFGWAGVMFFTSAENPGQRERAKKVFNSVFLGFVLVVSGWLIVQTLLSTLIKGDFFIGGHWNNLQCVSPADRLVNQKLGDVLTNTLGKLQIARECPQGYSFYRNACIENVRGYYACPAGFTLTDNVCINDATGGMLAEPYAVPAAAIYGVSGTQCSSSNPACSVAALQALGYTSTQANVMSCIAVTESSGNPVALNSDSYACGTFQITNKTSNGNWSNSALHAGSCSSASSCYDQYCNAQTAYFLSQNRIAAGQSPYADWTCPGCNNKALGCVQKYDPSSYYSYY